MQNKLCGETNKDLRTGFGTAVVRNDIIMICAALFTGFICRFESTTMATSI